MFTNYTVESTKVDPATIEPSHKNYDDLIRHQNPDGSIVLRYTVLDTEGGDGFDPIADDEAVEVVWFDNGQERNEWLEENKLTDRQFLIERYEHSLVHYSVVSTMPYPDRRWDVASGVGVITLDDQWADHVNLGELANQILDTYSDWCNGSLYGIVEERFDRLGHPTDEETVWGFIGYKNAQESLTGEFGPLDRQTA